MPLYFQYPPIHAMVGKTDCRSSRLRHGGLAPRGMVRLLNMQVRRQPAAAASFLPMHNAKFENNYANSYGNFSRTNSGHGTPNDSASRRRLSSPLTPMPT